jgi:hypothetical protein
VGYEGVGDALAGRQRSSFRGAYAAGTMSVCPSDVLVTTEHTRELCGQWVSRAATSTSGWRQ